MAISNYSLRTVADRLKDLAATAAAPAGRKRLVHELEGTIRRSRIGGETLRRVRLMYEFFRDPAEPLKPKLLIGAGLLYLVIPTDVIPDFIAGFGFTDDLAALTIVWNQVKDVLAHYEARRPLRLCEESD